jgi:CelD/BcsL family acetyltransferase involved in cellulose biosynthesis
MAVAEVLTIQVIDNVAALWKLAPEWNDLVERVRPDHPFLRHEWILSWYDAYGSSSELHILLARSDRELIGIAPLMISMSRSFAIPVRTVGFIYNWHTPRLDFLASRDSTEVYAAFWNHLVEHQLHWDVLQLSQLPADSPTLAAISQLAAQDGFLIGCWHSEDSPYVQIQGGWDKYLAGLRSHHRINTRSRMKRLEDSGDVQLEILTSSASHRAPLAEGLKLEAAGWKGRSGTAILSDPTDRKFYELLAGRLAASGLLRLIFLKVAAKRIAFAYAIEYQRKLYVLKLGYDPEFSKYSPYNVLCYLLFRNLFSRGLERYEFLGAATDWKLNWTSDVRPHYWLYVFPARARTRLLHQVKFSLLPWARQTRFYSQLHRAALRLKRHQR